jgi:hypothetical protein
MAMITISIKIYQEIEIVLLHINLTTQLQAFDRKVYLFVVIGSYRCDYTGKRV